MLKIKSWLLWPDFTTDLEDSNKFEKLCPNDTLYKFSSSWTVEYDVDLAILLVFMLLAILDERPMSHEKQLKAGYQENCCIQNLSPWAQQF